MILSVLGLPADPKNRPTSYRLPATGYRLPA